MKPQNATKIRHRVGVKSSIVMYPDVHAAIAHLKDEWGFQTTSETIAVAIRYLTHMTRNGLYRIDFDEQADPV